MGFPAVHRGGLLVAENQAVRLLQAQLKPEVTEVWDHSVSIRIERVRDKPDQTATTSQALKALLGANPTIRKRLALIQMSAMPAYTQEFGTRPETTGEAGDCLAETNMPITNRESSRTRVLS